MLVLHCMMRVIVVALLHGLYTMASRLGGDTVVVSAVGVSLKGGH